MFIRCNPHNKITAHAVIQSFKSEIFAMVPVNPVHTLVQGRATLQPLVQTGQGILGTNEQRESSHRLKPTYAVRNTTVPNYAQLWNFGWWMVP